MRYIGSGHTLPEAQDHSGHPGCGYLLLEALMLSEPEQSNVMCPEVLPVISAELIPMSRCYT